MVDKRRRIFYVDRVFQRRFLTIFLSLCLLAVVTNILFYILYLKAKIEAFMFQSHFISISRINEIIAGDVVMFNVIVGGIAVLAVLFFYSILRLKINGFFKTVQRAISQRSGGHQPGESISKFPEKFENIDRHFQEFFAELDKRKETENKRIARLKDFIARV